jgi:hypothetical protein
MKRLFKILLIGIAPIIDLLISPLVYISALLLRMVRQVGFKHFRISKKALLSAGVMPLRNHYYEPLFDKRNLIQPLSNDRVLPGIEWNIQEQVSILSQLTYSHELTNIPENYLDELTFHFKNDSFESGDAEYWYSIIRFRKPKRIIEIGSGHSTKMAQKAIAQNQLENTAYQCEHICIEPYEMPWLEKLNVTVIRERVEKIDKTIFQRLEAGDILFIDSSHVIRPQGDVLYEILELLPSLKIGVIVHVHDIFTPKDYPEHWVVGEVRFWNEQYLLEAFLTSNRDWKIIGALNFLHHRYYEKLKAVCPKLSPDSEPGSFYIQKVF